MNEIIINIAGNLDAVTGSEMYLKIKELLGQNYKIILDFSRLTGIDGSGEAFLEKTGEKARNMPLVPCAAQNQFVEQIQTSLGIAMAADRREAAGRFTEKTQGAYCPSCGLEVLAEGNLVCSGCGTRLYVRSGKATAFEKLF